MIWHLRTALAWFFVKGHEFFGFLIKALNELDFGNGRKSEPIIMLVQHGLGIDGVGFRLGSEIFDSENFILRTNDSFREFHKVKPPVRLVLEESEEEIEPRFLVWVLTQSR
ncbi:MAG: hypothetical protein IJR99_12580 [Kiritimatiellae bacterium]|nr:hypothetical protein [Kiritimatiellia bacterium]